MAWLLRRRNGGLWQLTPGQQIRVWQWPFGAPFYTARPVLTDHPRYYQVALGDTLGAIAARLHLAVGALAQQNGLGNANVIEAGQTLVLHHYTSRLERVVVPSVPASCLSMGLLLTDVANLVGLDAALLKAVAWHESGWRRVRGPSGEIGTMQLMPAMAQWVQRSLIGYPLDPQERATNILEGALLLRYYLDITGVNTHKTLALYHSGNMRADARNGRYLRAVLELRAWYYHHPRLGL